MKTFELCDCYIKEMHEILLQRVFEAGYAAYDDCATKRKLHFMLVDGEGCQDCGEVWSELEVGKEANLYYEIYKVTGIDGLGEEE